MNRRVVLSLTGQIVAVIAVLLLAPAGLALADGDSGAVAAYLTAAALAAAVSMLMRWGGRGASSVLHRKDAFGTVALTWVCLGVLGATPLLLDGAIHDIPGALFEAVSGFTTTGATVVADVDGLTRATNLWRCLMHWIGGMGIVVLFVAVFPVLGVGAKQLFKTEVPGPITEGLRPRVKETALALWWVYSGLTALCALLLWGFGMSVYDAICHAMSTLGTGGYSTHSASVGYWSSPFIHWTIAAFMLIAGLNFGLYYGVARGNWRALVRDPETRFYLGMNAFVILVVFASILARHGGVEPALRHASFQVLSVTTTTGFMTEDFDTYGELPRFLLIICMFIGASAGSTAGGLKVSRVLLLGKLFARELKSAVRPASVVAVRLGHRAVPESVLRSVLVFGAAYVGLFAVASGVVIAMGADLVTGASAAIACLSSIGPGLDGVGPTQNYGWLPGTSKLVLSFCMIAGRLELFALFALLTPDCWRQG